MPPTTVLKQGAKGDLVTKLQEKLNKVLHPSPQLVADGDFGGLTKAAVRRFQREAHLNADGVVGTNTWTALATANENQDEIMLPQFKLAKIAASYIGVHETGDNRAGNSPRMLEIFQADNLVINGKTDGYPWCAAFVSLCVQKLVKQSSSYMALKPPREPSVSRFLNIWAKDQNCLVFAPNNELGKPMKGDIVVFTFSHIGIVESAGAGSITTIEGNTNAGGSREGVKVARKNRTLGIVRKFIRLPITYVDTDVNQSIRNMC